MNAAIDICAQTIPHQLRAPTLEEVAERLHAKVLRRPVPRSKPREMTEPTRFDFWFRLEVLRRGPQMFGDVLVLGPSREGER